MKKRGIITLIILVLLVLPFILAANHPTIEFVSPTPANGSTQSNTDIYVNLSTVDTSDHYAFVDFDDDLVLWMRMDDTNNTGDPTDLSSYSNNGSLVGDALINETGYFGNASHLDGTGDNIDIPDIIEGLTELSISVWVRNKEADLPKLNVILDQKGSGADAVQLDKGTSETFSFVVYNDSQDTGVTISDAAYVDTNWHHLVGTYNGSEVRIYVDGANADSTPGSLTGIIETAAGNNLVIGVTFNGSIDEVLIFNRSLTPEEVNATFNASRYKYENNFTSLADGTHTFTGHAVDIAGNKNDTEELSVTIETTVPNVTINFPTNTTYVSSDIPLNFNITLSENGSVMYSLDDGVTNITMTGDGGGIFGTEFNATNSSIADGIYPFSVYANDTAGNNNYTEFTSFIVDTTVPLISFASPTENDGASISSDSINVTVSVTETNENMIKFILYNDTGIVNASNFTDGRRNINFTGLVETNYTYNVSINDSAGNINSTGKRLITLDTTSLGVTVNFPTATTYGSSDIPLNFNVTLSENGSVMYSLDDGVNNITMLSSQDQVSVFGLVFNHTNGSIADATYIFSVYANDTAGNNNYTENVTFTIDTSTSTSSSSSSSSSSGTPTWIFSYRFIDQEFSEIGTITQELSARRRIKIKISEEEHYVGVVSLNENNALMEIASDPQQVEFNIGETKKFDVTHDEFYDLEVTLLNIEINKANISLSYLHEEIPSDAGEEEEQAADEEIAEIIQEDSLISNVEYVLYGVIILGVVVLMIIVVLFYRKKRKK